MTNPSVESGRLGGLVRSAKKARAARRNGCRGGRPKGIDRHVTPAAERKRRQRAKEAYFDALIDRGKRK